jgi:hypothetical protein
MGSATRAFGNHALEQGCQYPLSTILAARSLFASCPHFNQGIPNVLRHRPIR